MKKKARKQAGSHGATKPPRASRLPDSIHITEFQPTQNPARTLRGAEVVHIEIDPRLQNVLDTARKEDTVEAVLLFRKGDAADDKSSPERILKKVAETEPLEFNVFGNLGAAAVRAKPETIKKLLKSSEVSVATLNDMDS